MEVEETSRVVDGSLYVSWRSAPKKPPVRGMARSDARKRAEYDSIQRRRLKIICSSCNEEWSDGHGDVCPVYREAKRAERDEKTPFVCPTCGSEWTDAYDFGVHSLLCKVLREGTLGSRNP